MATMTHKKPISVPKIALFEPDIPQNTAAIARTCACLGAKLEIIEPCGFLLSDKRFKRVVMDYMDTKNINFYQSDEEFFEAKSNDRIICSGGAGTGKSFLAVETGRREIENGRRVLLVAWNTIFVEYFHNFIS